MADAEVELKSGGPVCKGTVKRDGKKITITVTKWTMTAQGRQTLLSKGKECTVTEANKPIKFKLVSSNDTTIIGDVPMTIGADRA